MEAADDSNYSSTQLAVIELARAHGLIVRPCDQKGRLMEELLSSRAIEKRLQMAKAWQQMSEIRRGVLNEELSADPAWDILLYLYINQHAAQPVFIASARKAASVPHTTALRWIQRLIDQDWIVRADDAEDARRCTLALTEQGTRSIESALDATLQSESLRATFGR